MVPSISIASLKDRPVFLENVVDCLWQEWWHKRGVEKEFLRGLVREGLKDDLLPHCYVAYDGAAFVGTVSLIENDLEERPELSPWLAALWVCPERRGQGTARALMDHLLKGAGRAGFSRVYLNATADKEPFYTRLGWRAIEKNVGVRAMSVFMRGVPSTHAGR